MKECLKAKQGGDDESEENMDLIGELCRIRFAFLNPVLQSRSASFYLMSNDNIGSYIADKIV